MIDAITSMGGFVKIDTASDLCRKVYWNYLILSHLK